MKPFEPAPPAKDMKVRLKHNEFRDLVNELRDTADRYGGTDQLRDQLARTLARRVRPVPDIVEMRPVLERIDARLACDVLSASSTVEVLRLARDEIMVLAEEVRELRAALQHEADCVEAAKAEIEALRAKIDAMEQQEPVATVRINAINGNPSVDFVPGHHYLHHNDRLYLAPGAQPAPSVPDGFSREDLEAVADGLDGYEKTVNVGNVTGEGDDHLESTTAYAARFIRTMLAAAPEAKP